MKDTKFQITDDGSVGLYDYKTGDIYHSVTGAYKEAYEKFIYSSGFENFVKTNKEVSILDICYGIGYNSKAAIDCALKTNDKIKIKIDALDNNSYAASISPLIKDNINNYLIKFKLIGYLSEKLQDYYINTEDILSNPQEFRDLYLDPSICSVIDFLVKNHTKYCPEEIPVLLHNIYYQNISNSMERPLKFNNINNLNFNIFIGDARKTLNHCNSLYDFIFLDAFTPSKQPILWTYQFLSKIKSKMKNSSVLVTYSNSSPVRKALETIGFFIRKIIIDNKSFGTIATPDKSTLGEPLDKFELGLLNTKSGVPYYDNDTMTLTSDEILQNRKIQMEKSDLMGSTKYLKKEKNEAKI